MHTCRLSKFELAKQRNKSVNNVCKISLNVRGVFDIIVFQTCKADCRTVKAISDRPIYKPDRTLSRRSRPNACVIDCKPYSVPKLSSSSTLSVVAFPVTPEILNNNSPSNKTEL
jgi:hypothetical protein